jgi:hypothetical protein
MKTKGQFSSIRNILIHFTQDDLHRLASDSISTSDIIDSTTFDALVLDSLLTLRHATAELLAAACTRTTDPARIKILVNQITFSWKDKNGDSLRIRTANKLEECLLLAIDAQTTKFVLLAHCDLLYFASNFDGLDLDKADITPFPTPRPAKLGTSLTATSSPPASTPPALATTPPSDIFNYKALPLRIPTSTCSIHVMNPL